MELVEHLECLYRELLLAKDEELVHERIAYTTALTAKDETIGELRRRAEAAEAAACALEALVMPTRTSTRDRPLSRGEKIKQLFLS